MTSHRILIMGLPGSGKTTLATALSKILPGSICMLNADAIRKEYDDWDFSIDGRIRQSIRMRNLANSAKTDIVIIDMVAPLEIMRHHVNADYVIWVDTIGSSRFEDTNAMFEVPVTRDVVVDTKDCDKWAATIMEQWTLKHVVS